MGRMVWRFGRARGQDVDAIFRAADLDPAVMEQGAGRYPLERIARVWNTMLSPTEIPSVGLEIAAHFRILDVQTLGVAFMSSSKLITALRRYDRFERLLNSDVDHLVNEADHHVAIVPGDVPFPARVAREFDDARLAILVKACRDAVEDGVDPIKVAFPYAQPQDTAPYYGLFRCPLEFGAPRAEVWWSAADVAKPITTANRELAHSADHVLKRAIARLGTDDVIGAARREIIDSLPSGTPREEDIARALCMSGRTFQRKLAEKGASFTGLLADLRRELAEQYIKDPNVPVAEISYLLGFSEVSAFARAFKRWTGVPPGEYRERGA